MEFFGNLTLAEAAQKNVLALAYIGDAVQSLYVRERIIAFHDLKPDQMHKQASAIVNAATQAALAEKIFPTLTEEEKNVFLRGRNATVQHRSKNQSGSDYRKATGLEALIGYLYLTGNLTRLKEILETQL